MNPHRFNNVVGCKCSLLEISIGDLCSKSNVWIGSEVVYNINSFKVRQYGVKVGDVDVDKSNV